MQPHSLKRKGASTLFSEKVESHYLAVKNNESPLPEPSSWILLFSSSMKQRDALNEASKGRTTISIAHRLSTLKEMNVIYVVDKGVVVEHGSPSQLLSMGPTGIYWKMAEKQRIGTEDRRRAVEPKEEDNIIAPQSMCSTSASSLSDCSDGIEGKKRQPSFLRLYTHGHLSKIIPAVFFCSIRGFEIPLYALLFNLLFNTLNSTKDEFWPSLIRLCCVSFAIGAYAWTMISISSYFIGKASESVISTVKERILNRVLHQNAAHFDNPETSNATIVNNINSQSGVLIAGLDYLPYLFIWCSTSIIICDISAICICWQIGLIALTATVILLVVISLLFVLLSRISEQSEQVDRSSELALEIFAKARTIQIMAVEKYFEKKYTNAQEASKVLRRKAVIVQSIIWAYVSIDCAQTVNNKGRGSYLLH